MGVVSAPLARLGNRPRSTVTKDIMPSRITDASVEAMLTREKANFLQRNPKSRTLAEESSRYWLQGVPMHWMVDWGTPFPLFIQHASGIDLTDADGNAYVDFCLGDTGA